MTELEVAVSVWKDAYETAPIDRHPQVLVAYFGDEGWLGYIFGHSHAEADLVVALGAPFAYCIEVTDMFVFLDRPGHVLVSRISTKDNGAMVTDWRLPYTKDDYGRLSFGVAEKSWHPVERVRRACSYLVSRRLDDGPKFAFTEAFEVASKGHALG